MAKCYRIVKGVRTEFDCADINMPARAGVGDLVADGLSMAGLTKAGERVRHAISGQARTGGCGGCGSSQAWLNRAVPFKPPPEA